MSYGLKNTIRFLPRQYNSHIRRPILDSINSSIESSLRRNIVDFHWRSLLIPDHMDPTCCRNAVEELNSIYFKEYLKND
jgi:hypothetical protein